MFLQRALLILADEERRELPDDLYESTLLSMSLAVLRSQSRCFAKLFVPLSAADQVA